MYPTTSTAASYVPAETPISAYADPRSAGFARYPSGMVGPAMVAPPAPPSGYYTLSPHYSSVPAPDPWQNSMAYGAAGPQGGYMDPMMQQARMAGMAGSSAAATGMMPPPPVPEAAVSPSGRNKPRVPVYRTEGDPLRYSSQGRPLTHVSVSFFSVVAEHR